MALDHIVKHTCRFNIKNPQHKRVNEVLANLSPEICKSKSQFMINATEYYIDHFGKEAFIEPAKDDSPYVTKNELKSIEERTIEVAVTEAKNEIIRLLGGALSGVVNLNPLLQKLEMETEKEKKKVPEEQPMVDEAITEYALSYMPEMEE